jgi:hypothetical protein
MTIKSTATSKESTDSTDPSSSSHHPSLCLQARSRLARGNVVTVRQPEELQEALGGSLSPSISHAVGNGRSRRLLFNTELRRSGMRTRIELVQILEEALAIDALFPSPFVSATTTATATVPTVVAKPSEQARGNNHFRQ